LVPWQFSARSLGARLPGCAYFGMSLNITPTQNGSISDTDAVSLVHESFAKLREQAAGIIVGLEDVTEQIFITLICRGHCILEGVPGLAKTRLISTLASLTHLSFRRVQFTPDLMPGDITGSDVLEEDRATGGRVFRFIRGPLFGNVILADEINRTPPKTQSALLEAMEERQLTVGGQTYPLPDPFFVLATQNPIEQEGTYPLPEAQLDRFMLKIILDYPDAAQEIEIVQRATSTYDFKTEPVIEADQLRAMQLLVRKVPVGDHVFEYATNLVRATRPRTQGASDFVREMISWGAGPRASIFLIMAAKARALLRGRHHATEEDVAAMALPVLRHRIMPTFNAESEGVTADLLVSRLL
jgi:MoxR-like ATPase